MVSLSAAIRVPQVVDSLLEVSSVIGCEMRLVGRQIVLGKDRVLRAEIRAVAAVNALVGIDEYLGDGSGLRVARLGRDGGCGALRDADKVLDAGIGNYVGHDEFCSLLAGVLFLQHALR
jgi:hypothetical protein